MSSHKETHHVRTTSQSRPLASPMNVPHRHNSRNHSHSLSLGTLNSTHRVTRRKSMSSNNFLSVASAIQNIDDESLETLISPPSSKKTDMEKLDTKPRNRRASEGGFLSGKEGKRVSGELRCETCGKGYKHSSCLTKHLWEHTPEWTVTSKLLISKHQQVQLLEAASVLVQMNQTSADLGDDLMEMQDSNSSASPAASSDEHDASSVETTPPPPGEHYQDVQDVKRYSTTSSTYSQSYQSVAASSVPTSAFGSYHQGFARRPSTSGSAYMGGPHEDESDLAAAVSMCNMGTPRSIPLPDDDIPPVPPLPERYASHKTTYLGTTPLYHPQPIMPALTSRLSDERDVKMHTDDHEDYPRSVSRGNSDDYEMGVFPLMEV